MPDLSPDATAEIEVAEIKIEKLKDGSIRQTHPGGAVVIVSVEQQATQRAELVEQIADAQRQLADFDPMDARLAAK